MANLELVEHEAALLMEILEDSLSELRTERVRTDNRALHAEFVKREKLVEDVIRRLASLK